MIDNAITGLAIALDCKTYLSKMQPICVYKITKQLTTGWFVYIITCNKGGS